MKRTGLLLIIGVVAGLAVLGGGAVAPVPPQKPSEIEELRKEVAALRRRVESLEQRHQLRVIPLSPQDGKARPDVIDPYHGVRQVPPNWKGFEFNGMPYYIVPINHADAFASEAGKQAPPSPSPATPKTADNR